LAFLGIRVDFEDFIECRMEAKEVSDEELNQRLVVEEMRERQHNQCETTIRDILIKGARAITSQPHFENEPPP
jgi:hypothetical protein